MELRGCVDCPSSENVGRNIRGSKALESVTPTMVGLVSGSELLLGARAVCCDVTPAGGSACEVGRYGVCGT